MQPLVSIVIPTYNRADVLERTIRAFQAQEGVQGEFEIVVVDDGSTDGTPEILERLSKEHPEILRVVRQQNRGPAAARNNGIRLSSGTIILFAGDDVLPTPHLVNVHVAAHQKCNALNVGVLGKITWSPDQEITPLMKWLESSGAQFNFGAIDDPENVSADCFYSSNLSLNRSFLTSGEMFDERFTAACWEDIDLGRRLQKRGLRIVYCEEALGYHVHSTDYRRSVGRTRRAGYFEGMFLEKHGLEARLEPIAALLAKRVLGFILRTFASGNLRDRGFEWSFRWHEVRGIKTFLSDCSTDRQ